MTTATPFAKQSRVVVVGTGWDGSRIDHDLNLNCFALIALFIRNHAIFMPLLEQATTGTLEFARFEGHSADPPQFGAER